MVLQSRKVLKLRGKPVSSFQMSEAGAAPATVSGEPLRRIRVTGALRRREGRTEKL